MGLDCRWHEVAKIHAEVNNMLGDIIKVTPSFKKVGDLVLMMASGGISRANVENPDEKILFTDFV